MISDYYPPQKRGTMLAIYSSGVHVGVLLGFIIGGLISQHFGWRAAFMAVGIPGVIFAVLFFFTVKEPPRGHWESQQADSLKPTFRETLHVLASRRTFWYLSFGAGLAAFSGYGLGNFMPSFLIRNHGFEMTEVGFILAGAGGVGGIVGTLLGGHLADRRGAQDMRWYLWIPAIGSLLAIPLSVVYLQTDNQVVLIALIFLSTIFFNVYLAPCIAISHALVPPAMRALTSSVLYFILNMIGMGMGPLSVGLLSDAYSQHFGQDGLRYAMLTASVISSSAIVLFYLAARKLPTDLARISADASISNKYD
jgi:predicted MFS family arabinose efflux permease